MVESRDSQATPERPESERRSGEAQTSPTGRRTAGSSTQDQQSPQEGQSSEQGGEESPPGDGPPASDSATGSNWPGWLALLVALGVAGAGWYLYGQFDQRLGQLQQRLEEARTERVRIQESLPELKRSVTDFQQSLTNLQNSLGELESRHDKLAERVPKLGAPIEQLQARVEELFERLGENQPHWTLERVEGLLITASRLARLEGDADAAYAALQEADNVLEQLSSPAWLDTRKAIQEAMTHLEQVPQPDIPGMSFKLASLSQSVMDLPVQGTRPPNLSPSQSGSTPKEAGATSEGVLAQVGSALSQFWADVKALIRLRRSNEPIEPLLPPKEAYFLRHNLVLNLQAARLALLNGQKEVYEQSLEKAQTWIKSFFDTDSAAVQGVMEGLDTLQHREIDRELPDLHTPLEVFRRERKG